MSNINTTMKDSPEHAESNIRALERLQRYGQEFKDYPLMLPNDEYYHQIIVKAQNSGIIPQHVSNHASYQASMDTPEHKSELLQDIVAHYHFKSALEKLPADEVAVPLEPDTFKSPSRNAFEHDINQLLQVRMDAQLESILKITASESNIHNQRQIAFVSEVPKRPAVPQQPKYPERIAFESAVPKRPAVPQQPKYPERIAFESAVPKRPAVPQQPQHPMIRPLEYNITNNPQIASDYDTSIPWYIAFEYNTLNQPRIAFENQTQSPGTKKLQGSMSDLLNEQDGLDKLMVLKDNKIRKIEENTNKKTVKSLSRSSSYPNLKSPSNGGNSFSK
ncbi:MAG: hypothetical protein IPP74_10465 [Alphaproteobacteria bacterium]|nr:hypothetical protein [Alphaproteobacteria bacterium]